MFFTTSIKGNKFGDFLFASPVDEILPNMGIHLKKIIDYGSTFFPSRIDPL